METTQRLPFTRLVLHHCFSFALLLSAMNGVTPFPAYAQEDPSEATLGASTPAHYIVFEKHVDGTILPAFYRSVNTKKPVLSITDSQLTEALASPSRNAARIVVTLQTGKGEVVYRNVIRISPWLRGEFHGSTPDAPIDGYFLPQETIPFVVRVPQIEGTELVLENDQRVPLTRFDMQALPARTPPVESIPSLAAEDVSIAGGTNNNRVDFLVMGDGYTSSEATKFSTDATSLIDTFFSLSPYSTYRNYFVVHTLFTASDQSGADHPPYGASCSSGDPSCCSDPAMLSDPLQGTMVNTAFDSQFCVAGIHRLLVPNVTKVLAAAAAEPEWDSILVIVNDTTYGGSGGTLATTSIHASAALIAQHEYGHSFVDLADEYDSAYPGYPTCSDISGAPPCESNVTDETTRALVKWQPWIDSGTSIPTPNDSLYAGIVGLFEGARYAPTDMYRSGYACIMRNLGASFCQVPSQSFVLTLYNGGWGEPGINLIEPGTTSPASESITLTYPAAQVFKATTLGPIGGPPVQITWLVAGIPVPGETSDTFTFASALDMPSPVSVTLMVKDATSLVAPGMAGNALQDVYTWYVTIVIPPPPSVPTLASPATNALLYDYTPRLDWNNSTVPSIDAAFDHYQVQADDNTDFSSPEMDAETTSGVIADSEFTPVTDLASNTRFSWRVRAFNTAGIFSAWSSVRSFRTALTPPTLVSPAEAVDSLELRPVFDWDDVPTATGFTIQISRNFAFTQVIHTGNPTTSTYSPTASLPKNTTLYWRVLTRGANGPSVYSAARSFTTPVNPPPSPVLLLPALNALVTDTTPTFTWQPVVMPPGTTLKNYLIQVDDQAAFGSPEINDSSPVTPTFTPTGELAVNMKYFWRVRAVNTSGELSTWSTARYFRSAILPPSLLTPVDTATGIPLKPTLDWSEVPGNSGYLLQIRKTGTTPVLVKSVTLATNTSHYTFIANLLPNTPYFWKVQTRGANGPSLWSDPFDFTTGP